SASRGTRAATATARADGRRRRARAGNGTARAVAPRPPSRTTHQASRRPRCVLSQASDEGEGAMTEPIDISSVEITPEQFAELVRNTPDAEIESGMRAAGIDVVLDRIFQGMQERFAPDKAAGVDADISGSSPIRATSIRTRSRSGTAAAQPRAVAP